MYKFQQPLDIRISFLLRSTYENEDGKFPIVLRISYRGQRKDIFTGLYCVKSQWIKTDSRMAGLGKEAQTINQHLERIQYKVRENFDGMRFSGNIFTLDELVSKIKGQEKPPQTLMEYADNRINEMSNRVGIDIAKSTFLKYKRIRNYMEEFLKTKYNIQNIAVATVNEGLLTQLFKFLRYEKGNSHNSALTLMNCLRTILKAAIKSGAIRTNPFEEFKVGFKPVDRDYLVKEEIEKIATVEIKSEKLARSRDIFLFACYTGMAYADIFQLKRDNIKADNDGSYYIKKPRQKTSGMSIIPLIEPAIRILKQYSPTPDPRDFVWHVPCNQVLNRNLKSISQLCSIDKKLFMHLARHTFATTVTLSNGVPIETVSKMLGHTSLKHTIRYARVVADKVKTDMSKVREVFK